nr:unnamed protein product [Callosobruchus analis]
MTSNVEDVILTAAACMILCRRRVKSKQRFWVRSSLRARGTYSGTTLLKDLANGWHAQCDSKVSVSKIS